VWCGAFPPSQRPFLQPFDASSCTHELNACLLFFFFLENKVGTVLSSDATRLGWVSMDANKAPVLQYLFLLSSCTTALAN
jgi:hypothetical protein